MVMVTATDIGGDEDLARRVLAVARTFAPCIVNFDKDSEDGKTAIAFLKAAVTEVKIRGARAVKGQATGSSRVDYVVDGSIFSTDDRAALSALCAASIPSGALPAGKFPLERPVGRAWPETYR